MPPLSRLPLPIPLHSLGLCVPTLPSSLWMELCQSSPQDPRNSPALLSPFPTSPLPILSPPYSPHHPAISLPHPARSTPGPPLSVLSDCSGTSLCISGQLLKVTFVIEVLCALLGLLGGPSRISLSQSSPHFTRTPTPCLGPYGARCPFPLGCEQWSDQPFILLTRVKCILC